MKLRTKSRLKGILIPAIAALFLGAGAIACSSSGEEAAPDAAMAEDGAVSNTDPLANDANAAGGEGAAEEGGEVAAGGNNEELSNLVNDGSANAASAENPSADPALTNNAGADPFANPAAADATEAAGAANESGAGLNNGADPFAPANGAAAPNATVGAESNPATDAAGAASEGEAAATDAAPTDAAPMNPAAADAAAAPAGETTAEAAPATDAAPADAAPAGETPAEAPVATSGPSTGYVPENGSKMAYYVQKGDTLGTISAKIYGNKSKWKDLASGNNLSDPNLIYAGDVIYYSVDDSSRPFADKYESAPRQSVTVAQGDTLSSISAKVYGSEGSWRTLWKENPSVKNPDVLTIGSTLFYRGTAQASVPVTSEEGVAATEQE